MRKMIKDYVSSCEKCQKRKSDNQKKSGPISPVAIIESFFMTIHADKYGPLPKWKSGCRYVLTLTDDLSKFTLAFPLVEATATAINRTFFKNYICLFVIPKNVVTDNGSNFVSEEYESFFNLLGIKHIRTSTYHPQSNANIERFHRVLGSALTMFSNNDKKDRDEKVIEVCFSYNTSEHEVTGMTPYYLALE